jgi:hypothetical protein
VHKSTRAGGFAARGKQASLWVHFSTCEARRGLSVKLCTLSLAPSRDSDSGRRPRPMDRPKPVVRSDARQSAGRVLTLGHLGGSGLTNAQLPDERLDAASGGISRSIPEIRNRKRARQDSNLRPSVP